MICPRIRNCMIKTVTNCVFINVCWLVLGSEPNHYFYVLFNLTRPRPLPLQIDKCFREHQNIS